MCQVLDISPSGYYAWRGRPPSRRQEENEALVEQIHTVHEQSRRTYGSPRITEELQAQGVSCSRNRVARLMKEHGIQVKVKPAFKVTTCSKHERPIAPNLLQQDFAVDQPNRVWISDISYIATGEGWLYLCIVMDLFARKIIGWSMQTTLSQQLVLAAFDMAYQRTQPGEGVIFHSDRGSQYASGAFRKTLARKKFRQSMSRKGDCYDNAVAESFFHTLKVEEVYPCLYATRAQARQRIFDYIEVFYNRIRRHSYLGYLSPEAFEHQGRRAA
jgi:transposase InsO family protein